MRVRTCIITFALFAGLLVAATARADHEPVLVVPGRADVPIIINGRNAAWGVVESDWGLYRPGAVSPTVIDGPPLLMGPRDGGYYPSFGGAPARGRHEIEPPANRPLPPPAPTYYRNWSSQSDTSAPVTVYTPFQPPAVVVPPSTWPSPY
ncbi:MAG: hypothetical protein HY659_05440 [Rhizobiales bacterium]|nr:hypothetical protein [Hyphomicrobiales bacterium]